MGPIRGYVSELIADKLIELSKSVPYIYTPNKFQFATEHEYNTVSVYYYSKWYEWSRKQRADIRSILPTELTDVSWALNFTKYPANTGYLNPITQFRDRGQKIGKITAIALYNNQSVILNNEIHTLNKGDMISFPLNVIHSVPKASNEALWLIALQV